MGSYAPPTITSAGLSIPAYAAILADLLQQFLNIFGQDNYLGADTADYQIISSSSLKVSDTVSALQLIYNNCSPTTAVGAALDRLVKLNGLARKQASYSTVLLTLTGTAGAVITNGIVSDVNGNLWNLPASVTIGNAGTIMVTATAQNPGPISAPIATVVNRFTPTYGWTSVTNAVAAVAGTPIETDSQLRARQAVSVAGPSTSQLASVVAAVAAVSGVTRYVGYENPTGSSSTDPNGFNLPAHSLTMVVEGGSDSNVAFAIYERHGIGCLMNGTDSVTITDPNNNNASIAVGFYRVSYVPIYVAVTVHQFAGYTTATTLAIQENIGTYFNLLQIGETATLSALYAVAMAATPFIVSPTFSIRGIAMGTSPSPTGTSDLTFAFYQAAQGATLNVSVSFV